jgi:hypothetical protein
MAKKRIILLGDSIIDNGAYVHAGEPGDGRTWVMWIRRGSGTPSSSGSRCDARDWCAAALFDDAPAAVHAVQRTEVQKLRTRRLLHF